MSGEHLQTLFTAISEVAIKYKTKLTPPSRKQLAGPLLEEIYKEVSARSRPAARRPRC